jgi:hypothetical protein
MTAAQKHLGKFMNGQPNSMTLFPRVPDHHDSLGYLKPERIGHLQRASITQVLPDKVPAAVYATVQTPGQPLDTATRTIMEPCFDHDFSQVRVHTDAKAAESARAVNALAYTVGRDVVFGAGQFAPTSASGRRLLMHELTHVVQQDLGDHNARAEMQAEAVAVRPASGESVNKEMIGVHPVGLYRQAKEGEGEEKKPVKRGEGIKFDVPPEKVDLKPGTTPSKPVSKEESTEPGMPSRIPLPWFSKGSFSLGLRLGFEELSSKSELQKTWLDASGDPSKRLLQRAKIINYMLTGKVPTGWEETDKGQLASAMWGIFSMNIAPGLASKISGALSTQGGPGGLSYEADLILITDFSKEIGGGLSFTLRW